jgi:hypothetical protein
MFLSLLRNLDFEKYEVVVVGVDDVYLPNGNTQPMILDIVQINPGQMTIAATKQIRIIVVVCGFSSFASVLDTNCT